MAFIDNILDGVQEFTFSVRHTDQEAVFKVDGEKEFIIKLKHIVAFRDEIQKVKETVEYCLINEHYKNIAQHIKELQHDFNEFEWLLEPKTKENEQ